NSSPKIIRIARSDKALLFFSRFIRPFHSFTSTIPNSANLTTLAQRLESPGGGIEGGLKNSLFLVEYYLIVQMANLI
ncbi:hypothetical protein, partial [Paenibacillus thalictri]|uniref:hypothetical protein n=1 Tax=Paenibacillus thalictri TaxID=2527873 RepID=UPI00197F6A42